MGVMPLHLVWLTCLAFLASVVLASMDPRIRRMGVHDWGTPEVRYGYRPPSDTKKDPAAWLEKSNADYFKRRLDKLLGRTEYLPLHDDWYKCMEEEMSKLEPPVRIMPHPRRAGYRHDPIYSFLQGIMEDQQDLNRMSALAEGCIDTVATKYREKWRVQEAQWVKEAEGAMSEQKAAPVKDQEVKPNGPMQFVDDLKDAFIRVSPWNRPGHRNVKPGPVEGVSRPRFRIGH